MIFDSMQQLTRLFSSIVNHILFRHHCNVFTTGACLAFSLNPSTYNKYYFVLYEFFYDTDKLDEKKKGEDQRYGKLTLFRLTQVNKSPSICFSSTPNHL
jgi:hypothetical protein